MAKNDKTEEPNNAIDTDAATANQNALSTFEKGYNKDRDLINQILGQAQATEAISKISRTIGVSKLAFVKETKLYKALKGMSTPNGSEILSGTWNEFCGLLGYSVDKADTDIANLKAFGEEALDSMNTMGIGYRDLRQFRKLPEDERLALIETAKTGDKETFIELAEEIISKHSREKETLAKQVEELTADAEAKDRVISDKNTKLSDVETELAKTKKRIAKVEPDQVDKELREEAAQHAFAVEAGIRGQLREALQAVQFHGNTTGIFTGHFLAGVLDQIDDALAELRVDLCIERSANAGKPEWEGA